MTVKRTESPASAGSSPSSCCGGDGRPKFELHRYNPRRAAREAEAAEVKVTWPDGEEEYLWMSERDLNANMKEWGACDGLLDALNAYRQNAPILAPAPSASAATPQDDAK